MQIHVVQKNETLTQIAHIYGTSVAELIKANEPPNPNDLVTGQTLVIPIVGSFYTVQAGDSLWSIGKKFHIPDQTIARINGIPVNQPLQVGMRLYIPPRPKRTAYSNAYAETSGKTVSESLASDVRKTAPYLSYLTIFSYHAKRDGSLEEPALDDLPAIAKANNNILVMAISNQENGAFSGELGSIILHDIPVQDTLLKNIITTAKEVGFRDIHFDFEYLNPNDREAYNQFLRKAKALFSKEGFLLSTALAPKTSAEQAGQWYEAHDYQAHGEIADFVIIMTYEWGYSGGPPMPVSPIGPVRDVLDFAVSVIPPEKIMMGQNLYGYDWTLPFVEGGPSAKAVSMQGAIRLAAKYNAEIKYDHISQAPYFNYVDENNKTHIVWFEDARSIQAKFDLLEELKLRGISYWKLGLPFPQNWLLLNDRFHIVKA